MQLQSKIESELICAKSKTLKRYLAYRANQPAWWKGYTCAMIVSGALVVSLIHLHMYGIAAILMGTSFWCAIPPFIVLSLDNFETKKAIKEQLDKCNDTSALPLLIQCLNISSCHDVSLGALARVLPNLSFDKCSRINAHEWQQLYKELTLIKEFNDCQVSFAHVLLDILSKSLDVSSISHLTVFVNRIGIPVYLATKAQECLHAITLREMDARLSSSLLRPLGNHMTIPSDTLLRPVESKVQSYHNELRLRPGIPEE